MKAKKKIRKKAKAKKASPKLALKKEDQFGVILEDINSKFDYLAEGYGILKKGQGVLDAKIDRNHEEFIEFRDEANSKFNTILQQLFNIDDELQFIKSEITGLRMELKKKADLNRLESLEKRVRKLEASNVKLRALAMQPKS